MFTISQTPAAGVNFDGLTSGVAGTGLIDFSELILPEDPNIVPILTSISYDNDAVETITIECFLKPAAAPVTTTIRKTIRRPAAAINGFNVDGCSLAVPRVIEGSAILTPWVLILITAGKTAVGSFVASFTMGPVPGCGC